MNPESPTHSRSVPDRQTVGRLGESLAADYLTRAGFIVIARNWRCPQGELDIVAQDGGCFVAVEVKTRTGSGCGSPLEAITARKAARLRRLLLDWNRAHGHRSAELRIDAIGILLGHGAPPFVDHLRGI